MAGRIVNDEVDLPEVDGIRTLTKTVESVSTDPFRQPAEVVKELEGQSPGFKRHVTAELKKFQRGVDGAATKTIHESQEFLNGYDTYEVIEPNNNLETLARLYEESSPHHAAVDAKVANIVALGHRFVETPLTRRNLEKLAGNEKKLQAAHAKLDEQREKLEETIEGWNEEDTFTEILIKIWRDYETMGNAYLEVSRNKDGSIGFIGHIPAQTMRVRRKRDGFVQMTGFKVQFFAHFGAGIDKDTGAVKRVPNPIGGGTPNEVIHIKKYSPTSGYYGVPDIVAASHAIAGLHFAAQFNLDYFENKAVPRYAIILKGATLGSNAEEQLLSFFETGLKGQNHRSVYIPLPSDTPDNKVELELKAIEANVQEASFTKYNEQNINSILMAHRVPITKISASSGASVATAKDADKTFKEQVCEPEQKIFEKKVNRLIKELTDAFELKLNEMSLTDENTQSQIDERYLKYGAVVPNEVRARQGHGGLPGGAETFPDRQAAHAVAAKTAPGTAENPATTRTRDATRSANRTDSAPGGGARNPKGEGRTTP
jgi:PBSX family phage portal protein